MNRLFSVLFFATAFSVRILCGQEVTVTASVDSQAIAIGDWIRYSVRITHPASVTVLVPSWKDTIGSFDIVRQDSLVRSASGETVELSKQFIVTKFDAGYHTLPPFVVSFAGADGKMNTAQSNPIPIDVRGIEVDTTQAIRDVKPPLSVPMSAEEIALYIALALGFAAGGYGVYYYLRKRKKTGVAVEEEKPDIPPHILALIQLDELESRGLWKQGEVKLFYSNATEIVRRYFEQRYGIMALEMTTGEVMGQLRKFTLPQEVVSSIERFLTDADLVKFAKHQPVASENEQVIPAARSIVERTKPVETVPQDEPMQELVKRNV